MYVHDAGKEALIYGVLPGHTSFTWCFMHFTESSHQPYDVRSSIDIVVMKNQTNGKTPLRPREGNVLSQGHTAGQPQAQEENRGLPVTQLCFPSDSTKS